jgi:hypothetical protein
MVQPANRRLATEQYVTDAVDVVADELSDGLATKVNSSTYVAGLAGKQDAATLGADVAADATVRAAYTGQAKLSVTGALPAFGGTAFPSQPMPRLFARLAS